MYMEVLGNLHYVSECQSDKLAIMLSKIFWKTTKAAKDKLLQHLGITKS